jgi:hypothetical protein
LKRDLTPFLPPGANKRQNIQTLIKLGADLSYMNGANSTPPRQAVTRGGQFDIALMLLEAGADHMIYEPNSNSRLVHLVDEVGRLSEVWTPKQTADYQALVTWLEDHGESMEQAKADNQRWESWSITTGEYNRKMAQEVAARKAREARAKKPGDDAGKKGN